MDTPVPERSGKSHPFMCAVCNKSYTRIDHLGRHSRLHTRDKSFRCNDCGKSFGRGDLLKRHARLHTPEATAERGEKEAAKRRTRVSQACANCATAKIKCTQEKPCKRCNAHQLVCEPKFRTHTRENSSPSSVTSSPAQPPRPASRNTSSSAEDAPCNHSTASQKNLQENQPSVIAPVGVHENKNEIQSQKPQPTQTFEHGHPTQMTLPDDGISALPDLLCEMPHITQSDNTVHSLNDPQTHHDHHSGCFARGCLTPVAFTSLNTTSLSLDAQQDGNSQGVELEVDDFNPVWGYDNTKVNRSHSTHIVTEIEVLQSNRVVSYCEQNWHHRDVRENVTLETSRDDENIRATPSNILHNRGCKTVDEASSEANEKTNPAQSLLPASRDRIIGLLAHVCTREKFQKNVSTLGSLEVLDDLVRGFMASFNEAIDSMIHFPSLNMRAIQPELLTMLVASGAIVSTQTDMHSLGYAMEEACRLAILNKVSQGFLKLGQTRTRPVSGRDTLNRPAIGVLQFDCEEPDEGDLQFLQAYALQLRAGMWSGNNSKMKCVEAEVLPLITTLRRWGLLRLQRPSPLCVPTYNDSPDLLHRKWMTWVEHESFKRLVYHTYLFTSQMSITLQTPPLLSYAEISLELPIARPIWLAPTAEEWRDQFTAHIRDLNGFWPTFGRCIFNIGELVSYYKEMDINMVLHAILGSYWKLIWDYRQLITVAGLSSPCPFFPTDRGPNSSTESVSLLSQQGLSALLKNFNTALMEQQISLHMETQVLYEIIHANIYAPFEHFHLLAGMEGEQEVRRAYPLVKRWFGSKQSRQAIWHAGQLLRATAAMAPPPTILASAMPPTSPNSNMVSNDEQKENDLHERPICAPGTGSLRGFGVIAVYNAWLALWAYGFMSRARLQECRQIDGLISHIPLGLSTNPPPSTVPPGSDRGCSRGYERSTSLAGEESFIYLDDDRPLYQSRRDEFINNERWDPVIHSTLLPGLRCQFKNLHRSGAQNDIGVSGGCNEAVADILPSDHSTRATNTRGSPWKSKDLTAIPINKPDQVVRVVIDFIKILSTSSAIGHERYQAGVPSEIPPLAENLTRLMEHLGRAAEIISA